MTKQVVDIVAEYLEANEFDGLYSEDGECACLTHDLAPCGNIGELCQAGYRVSCDCGDHDFHIVGTK